MLASDKDVSIGNDLMHFKVVLDKTNPLSLCGPAKAFSTFSFGSVSVADNWCSDLG
jgi:hypothetical protein